MERTSKGIVYIASPYRTKNIIKKIKYIVYAKKLTREAMYRGYTPIATHLFLTRVLNDNKADERELGLKAGQELLQKCDYILIGTKYGTSKGMKKENQIVKC